MIGEQDQRQAADMNIQAALIAAREGVAAALRGGPGARAILRRIAVVQRTQGAAVGMMAFGIGGRLGIVAEGGNHAALPEIS